MVQGMLIEGSYEGLWAAIHEFNARMEKKEKEHQEWLKKNVKLWIDDLE